MIRLSLLLLGSWPHHCLSLPSHTFPPCLLSLTDLLTFHIELTDGTSAPPSTLGLTLHLEIFNYICEDSLLPKITLTGPRTRVLICWVTYLACYEGNQRSGNGSDGRLSRGGVRRYKIPAWEVYEPSLPKVAQIAVL